MSVRTDLPVANGAVYHLALIQGRRNMCGRRRETGKQIPGGIFRYVRDAASAALMALNMLQ